MTQVVANQEDLIQALQQNAPLAGKVFQQKPKEQQTTSFSSRKESETSDLSLSDDSESEQSTAKNEDEYHHVSSAKVLGVHKQERPKVNYLYVIIVKWSDKSQVTIYRRWKEIKEFQDTLLTVAKNNKAGETKRYLKKTIRRVRNESRFVQGTMQKLKMIDGLNNFFESVTHFKDLAQCNEARRFFKPNDRDLSSTSWSGDGRTYFYITRDLLCERNNAYVADDPSSFIEEDEENNWSFKTQESVESENSEDSLNVALDIAYEPDPNITWPISSSVHVAICEYNATHEDKKENIISLKKDEEVDVLDRNESGWWLVARIDESNPSYKAPECGYVPSDYLQPKEVMDAFSESLLPDSVFDYEQDYEYYDQDADEEGSNTSSCSSEDEADEKRLDDLPVLQTQMKPAKSSPALSDSSSDSAFEESELRHKNHAKYILLKNGYPSKKSLSKSLSIVVEQEDSNVENKHPLSSTSSSAESTNHLPTTNKHYTKRRIRKSSGISPLVGSRTNSMTSLGPRTRSAGSSGVGSRLNARMVRRSTLGMIQTNNLGSSMPNVAGVSSNGMTQDNEPRMNSRLPRRSTLATIPTSHLGLSMPDVSGRVFSHSPSLSAICRSSSNLPATPPKGIDYISIKGYEATNTDELSFKEGAIIKVHRKNSNGWWLASYQGQNGLVPGVNLKKYNDPLRRFSLHVFEML